MKSFTHTKLLKLFAYLSIVFTPIVPALIWLGFFIFCDLVTGIWKAKKLGERIHSKKLGNTVTKVVMYFLVVICSHVLDTELLKVPFLPFTITQAAIGFVSVTEFKSIMENISSILGMDVLKYLRSKVDLLRNTK